MNEFDEFEDGIDYSSINLAEISPSRVSDNPGLSNNQCQQRRSPDGGPHEQHSFARLPDASGTRNAAMDQRRDEGCMTARASSGQTLSGQALDTGPVVPESVNNESAAELRKQVSV